jgi:hypothetical protein
MRLLALAGLVALVGLAGCRSLPPPAPPTAVTAPEEVLALLRARQETARSFQAKGRLTYLSRERNYSGTGLLRGSLPTTLRVDVLDFLGRSLLSFYSDGQEVQVLSPKEARLYSGPATPGNLAAFIPPGVTLPQVVRLLLGDLPLSPGAPARWQYEPARGEYLFEWQNPAGTRRERLWVEVRNLNPVKDEWYDAAGEPGFTVELKDFGQLAPGRPGQLTLRTFQPQAELRLAYKDLQVNPQLLATDLLLRKSAGVTEVPLKP